MIFHFTNKMIEKTNAGQLPVRNDVDPLGSWRVNIIQDERDKLVVFMNDATRYVILLDNPPLKNLEKLFSAFLDQLLQVMLTDQINTEVFLAYFNEFRGIDLAKNSDPKKTAEMIGSSVNVCDLWGISNDVRMSQYVNHLKLKSLGYHFPTASFMEALTRYDRPVRLTHAYDLLCVLQLKNGSARRKIRVSDYFTFDDLHRIIQAAFGWLDYHLYEFEFYHKKSSKRSILLDGYEDPDGDP
ncbi:MAG: plasmid pRiA4b ORF-3 family protein, partial [Bifidobacteriaceae bacterium]|nr:plasmid pRiA4b ORF-3 family protein [Bifidobacteriaceae bacterium]